MDTKYGQLPYSAFEHYRKSIIDRIWLLIPLKEENCPTLHKCIERLNRELCGMIKITTENDEYLISVICLLENLMAETDFATYKHDVFRCCELLSKMYGGDNNV